MRFDLLPLAGGPYRHFETYFEYDGPQTFALKSTSWDDAFVVGNTVDDNEELGTVKTLFVLVGGERFRAMRSGTISFREIYASAWPGDLWTFESHRELYIASSATPLAPDELLEEWLPTPEVRLDIPTSTVEAYDPEQVKRLAESRKVTTFALKVNDPRSRTTSFPTKSAGMIQVALDGAITAISREIQGVSSRDREHGVRTNVFDLRAASFVVVMSVDLRGGLFEDVSHSQMVMKRLAEFMGHVESGNTSALFDFMHSQVSSVRNRLRDLLDPISENQSGMGFDAAVPGREEVFHSRATVDNVKMAADGLHSVPPAVTYPVIERGILTGLLLRTKRFEIVDAATGTVYKGYMTDAAARLANNLTVGDSSFVWAKLRAETPFFNGDQDAGGVKHVLEEVSTLE